MIKCK